MTESEAIEIIKRVYNISAPSVEKELLFEKAIEEKAIKALELAENLKALGYCHNYQNEKSYLVNWIDSVNNMLIKYNNMR